MPTAEELVLAIRSEGVSDTRSELEGVEQTMDETAESAGDSAEELSGFSESFAGAMTAAVTALAVGGAALLSQIPILGEAFAGVAAIAQALAFQIDQLARQLGAGAFVDKAFEAANFLYELEGVAGDVAGAFAAIVSVAAIVGAAMLKFGVSAGALVAKLSPLIAAVKGVVAAIAAIVGVSVSTVAAIGVLIAAIAALAAALIFNIGGARDKTVAAIGMIIDVLGDLAAGARAKLMGVIDAFVGLAGDLVEWADNIASDAYQWGTNLIGRFIAGIREALSAAGDFLGDIEAAVGIDFPSAGAAGDVLGDIGGSVGTVANTAASAFAGRGQSGRGGQGGGTVLDGRQLAESTGRYRSGPARRQGL